LARAALAGDEDGGLGGRDATGETHRPTERRRRAQHRDMLAVPVLPLELRLDGQGFARHGDGVGRATYQDLQVRRRERLGEIIPRAGAQRFEARIDARVAGDHEDEDRESTRLNSSHEWISYA